MKMAARASYKAVPSMLMVAPTGSTKRVTRLSTWLFSSRHLKVMGSVAELWYKYKEVRNMSQSSDHATQAHHGKRYKQDDDVESPG